MFDRATKQDDRDPKKRQYADADSTAASAVSLSKFDNQQNQRWDDQPAAKLLDMDKPLTVQTVAAILDNLADEPGESATLGFEGEVSGTFYKVLKATFGIDFSIRYSVGRSNKVALSANLGAELGGALDLKVVEIGGAGGTSMGLSMREYDSSYDAAVSLLTLLALLEKLLVNQTGKSFFKIDPSALSQIAQPLFRIDETEVSASAGVAADFGDLLPQGIGDFAPSAEFEYSWSRTQRTFTGQEGAEYNEVDKKKGFVVKASFQAGDVRVSGAYSKSVTDTFGSPYLDRNDQFRKSSLSLTISASHKKDVISDEFAFTEKMQSIWDAAAQVMPGIPLAQASIINICDDILTNATTKTAGSVTLVFDWVDVNESARNDQEIFENQFWRIGIKFGGNVALNVDGEVAGLSLKASASKFEVLHEQIGTNTLTFARRMFIGQRRLDVHPEAASRVGPDLRHRGYADPSSTWHGFVRDNQLQLAQLVLNSATRDTDLDDDVTTQHHLYIPAVAASLGQHYLHPSQAHSLTTQQIDHILLHGLSALENHWREEETHHVDVRDDMTVLAQAERGTVDASEIVTVLQSRDPGDLEFILDNLHRYNVSVPRLIEVVEASGTEADVATLRMVLDEHQAWRRYGRGQQ